MEEKEYKIKIIFLGESGVGKTNLINIYMDKKFNPNEFTTKDPTQSYQTLKIGNIKLDISLWDSIGQEKFRSITKSYIRGSNIVIFVYDITKRETFLELNYWVSVANEELNNNEAIFGIAGNKTDLFAESEVDKKEAEKYATKINALFSETSAKQDPKGFKIFIKELLGKLLLNQKIIDNTQGFMDKSFHLRKAQIKKQKEKEKKCCQ